MEFSVVMKILELTAHHPKMCLFIDETHVDLNAVIRR